MWIGVEKMLKLTNLKNRLNNQFHVWEVKFWPKTENWNMNPYDDIFHVGSWRNMFQSNVRFISWDSDKNVWMQSGVDELVAWSSMKEKFWSLVKKCFVLRKQVKVDEKFKFWYLEKFSHSKNLDGMENLEKLKLNPLFYRKSHVKLSLLCSSHSLQS